MHGSRRAQKHSIRAAKTLVPATSTPTAASIRRNSIHAGISPDSIKDIDDIKKLPFTTKDDMRDNYPFNLFSMPVKNVQEIHVSSGTTGNPDRRRLFEG